MTVSCHGEGKPHCCKMLRALTMFTCLCNKWECEASRKCRHEGGGMFLGNSTSEERRTCTWN